MTPRVLKEKKGQLLRRQWGHEAVDVVEVVVENKLVANKAKT